MKNGLRTTALLLALVIVGTTQQGFLWKKKAETDVNKKQKAIEIAHKAAQLAPSFTLQNQLGESVSLDQFKRSYVVLEWTNHKCPYVKKHYKSGNMQSMQAEYTQQGVVWLSIISSAEGKAGHVSGAKAQEIANEKNAKPSHILFDTDGKVGRSYNATTTPHMFIIDPEGWLVYRGAVDDNPSANPAFVASSHNYVKEVLDAVLDGKPAPIKNTKSYGCSIKY